MMNPKYFYNCKVLLWHRLTAGVHLLQHGLIHGPQCLQGRTCCSTATARDALSWICSALGWLWPQAVRVPPSHLDSPPAHRPLDRNSRGAPACPAQAQQRYPGHLPAQVCGHCCYQTIPRHSSEGIRAQRSSESKTQPLTSTGLWQPGRRAPWQAQEPAD